jgi:putative endonuclease
MPTLDMAYHGSILASRRHGPPSLGAADNQEHRLWEHRAKAVRGVSSRYNVDQLVWCEVHDRIDAATTREKALKKWRRDWKLRLTEKLNPDWDDLHLLLDRQR